MSTRSVNDRHTVLAHAVGGTPHVIHISHHEVDMVQCISVASAHAKAVMQWIGKAAQECDLFAEMIRDAKVELFNQCAEKGIAVNAMEDHMAQTLDVRDRWHEGKCTRFPDGFAMPEILTSLGERILERAKGIEPSYAAWEAKRF